MPKSFAGVPTVNFAQPPPSPAGKYPTLNNEVPSYLQPGRITPKPVVQRLDRHQVPFVDGMVETVDMIICARGDHVASPFLPTELQQVCSAMGGVPGGLRCGSDLGLPGPAQLAESGVGKFAGRPAQAMSETLERGPSQLSAVDFPAFQGLAHAVNIVKTSPCDERNTAGNGSAVGD
jgi:hypothetical protein